MKYIIGILIGISLSVGSLALAQNTGKLIMIPEYIGGYASIELLNYIAKLKDIEINKMPKSTSVKLKESVNSLITPKTLDKPTPEVQKTQINKPSNSSGASA